jgi:multidrug transporter EmrE-like cation transporter
MPSLIAAILCSASIALILKRAENRKLNRFVLLAVNYATATAISLFLVLQKGLFKGVFSGSLHGLLTELAAGHHGTDGFLGAGSTAVWAVLIGVPTGVLYFRGFYYYQKSVGESGVGLAGSYAKMGILVPMVLSMVFWRELPSGLQWAGMALALTAIGMVNLDLSPGKVFAGVRPSLLMLFLTCGVSEFTGKLYQRYGMSSMKDLFLFFLFITAFTVSLFNIRKRPKKEEVFTGMAVGIPNLFASFFLIKALSSLPAAVVFPAYSAGSIALICMGGMAFYRERQSGKEYAAIALTVTALVLVNMTGPS